MQFLIITQHVRPSAQAVPLAAGSLKAALPPELQQNTTLIDLFPGYNCDVKARELLSLEPAVIGFSLYLWNRNDLLTLARRIKELEPEVVLIAGGPEASADSSRVLAEGRLDGVIRGEGEDIFAEILLSVERNEKLLTGPGLLAADNAEQIPDAVVCKDLEQLPSPWLNGQLSLEQDCGVLWEVARGCQFNCAFCYDAKGHSGVRPFPFERLKKELELFVRKGVAQIWVLDSSFNAPEERGEKLLRLLLEVAPQIHYHIEAKSEYLNDELTELLGQLSCSVQIGLQSSRQQVLTPLHRHLDQKKMTKQLEQLSYAGVTYGLDLIYGLPNDNHLGFCESLDYALDQQPNQVDIFPLSILPGTEIYEHQERFQIWGHEDPPYLQKENRSYNAEDFATSEELAAATDIFYNRGRAVGFFKQLTSTLQLRPSVFLQQFYNWLSANEKIERKTLLNADLWQPQQILPLQLNFCHSLLPNSNEKKLRTLIADLLNFNYCCSETLLAGECQPQQLNQAQRKNPKLKLRLNPQVQLRIFNYALDELAELAELRLDKALRQLNKQNGNGIFLQQQGELVMETLDDQFAALLKKADRPEGTARDELMAGMDRSSAQELIEFSIAQGILLPAT
jgi:radical SAM superfamily enzyme YgiQ (UPF0313 family)